MCSVVIVLAFASARGRGPRSLVVDGTFAPHDIERVLVDLARQGAISAVLGDGNEDRVIAARKDRGETALPMRTPSLLPPRMAAVELERASAATTALSTRAPPDGVVEDARGGDDEALPVPIDPVVHLALPARAHTRATAPRTPR